MELTDNPRPKPGPDHQYLFGALQTDHMLEIDYDQHNGGWQKPKIVENQPFELDPANATLHYSIECFEGTKAYRTHDDQIIIFRPDENFKRMQQSHLQLGIPTFDPKEMLECCRKLIEVEKDWIPTKPLHSLYIRPTSICMDDRLGLSRVRKSKTFIILSPVGPYYPRGFVPLRLFCDRSIIRAWPNGFGSKKIGGNYGPTIRTQRKGAQQFDCDQALWLLHDYVTEVGTMNFFVFWKNEHGEDELVTPPLDGTILPGVTRMSLLKLMQDLNEFKVSIREFKIQDLVKAAKENRVYEAFGAGTACIVSPVASVNFEGEVFKIPIDEKAQAGPLTQRALAMMTDLQYGRVKKPEWQHHVCAA